MAPVNVGAAVGNGTRLASIERIRAAGQACDAGREIQCRRPPVAGIPIVAGDARVAGNILSPAKIRKRFTRRPVELISNRPRVALRVAMRPGDGRVRARRSPSVGKTKDVRTVRSRALIAAVKRQPIRVVEHKIVHAAGNVIAVRHTKCCDLIVVAGGSAEVGQGIEIHQGVRLRTDPVLRNDVPAKRQARRRINNR